MGTCCHGGALEYQRKVNCRLLAACTMGVYHWKGTDFCSLAISSHFTLFSSFRRPFVHLGPHHETGLQADGLVGVRHNTWNSRKKERERTVQKHMVGRLET